MTISLPSQDSTQYSFLIIGYGNELRGDDAVGPRVAMAVADWQLPSVKALVVHQLTPDLAADIAKTDYVIFVDACGEHCNQPVQINPIVIRKQELPTFPLGTHSCDSSTLLNLTQRIYGCHPQAWLLEISTECLSPGTQLSSTAHQGCDRALRIIEQFFTTYRQPHYRRSTDVRQESSTQSAPAGV